MISNFSTTPFSTFKSLCFYVVLIFQIFNSVNFHKKRID